MNAYDALILAAIVEAGPCYRPRAPSCPGDIKPQGVAQWLSESPDFDLLWDMAEFGADLHYTPDHVLPVGVYDNRVPPEHHQEVSAQIQAEVAKGWLKDVTSTATLGEFANAPLQVVVEPSKVRRITDYSNVQRGLRTGVNALVDMDSLGEAPMHRPRDLAQAVWRLSQSARVPPVLLVRDVSKAFRRIGVSPGHARSLRTVWEGRVYEDQRLPFGHAASAHLCCKLTRAVADAVSALFPEEAKVLAYVDDFVLVSVPERARDVQRAFEACMEAVGLPMSETKAEESGSWSTSAAWIGFVHDTVAKTHCLPQSKKDGLVEAVSAMRNSHSVSHVELQQLVGRLSHVSSVFTAGRAFLVPLYNELAVAGKLTELSHEAKADLQWWESALHLLPEVAAMRKPPSAQDLVMVTDAALSGQGLCLYRTVEAARRAIPQEALDLAFGKFGPRGVSGDMMLLEAVAALSAVQRWGPVLSGKTGYILLDNEPLEWSWKKGRSKSPRVNAVLRAILLLLLQYDAQVFPLRVQSSDNVVADALSRIHEPGSTGWTQVQQWALPEAPHKLPECDPFNLVAQLQVGLGSERLRPRL